MDNQQRQGPGLPISGGAVVIALILGSLFVQQPAFKGSRPKVSGHGVSMSAGLEDVQARLWEDPFAAVRRHRSENPKNAPETIESLAEQIVEKNTEEVTVLGVMVFGGPYAKDAERRIRSRHATLSALAALDYVPDNAEHLRYIKIDLKIDNATKERLTTIVPYEWFIPGSEPKHKLKREILVLWLKDDDFYPTPLAKIGELRRRLQEKPEGPKFVSYSNSVVKLNNLNFKKIKHCNINKIFFEQINLPRNLNRIPKFTFKILGPAGSTNLRAMLDEILKSDSEWEELEGVSIFSPSATAEDELLLEKYDHCNFSNVTRVFEDKVKPVTFLRTIGTDRVLTDALVEELARRGADPLDPKNHIALISEWDTFYGRALPRTFIKSVKNKKEKNKKEKNKKEETDDSIHRFSYLRGIDGQLPGDLHSDASGSVSSANKNRDKDTKALERPVGHGQFDYLRRLATSLEHCDEEIKRKGKGRIKAIGVLGSDVYDKLLVLQALRDRFPGAVFFTTDLDASLLHPEEYKWAHNLVIASNFGLELHPELQRQKGIPPFRDNYQTSLFFSTMMALDSNQTRIQEGIKKEKWLQPRIFEVSRSGAFDLSINQEEGENKIGLDGTRRFLTSIHPLRPDLGPSEKTEWAIALALLLAVVFFSLYRWYFGYLRAETNIRLPALYFVKFAVFGAFVLAVIIYKQGCGGEPFALFEGISVWPTEFLRFFSGVLSLYFMYFGYRKIRDSDKMLSRFFLPKQTSSPGKRSLAERRAGNGSVDTVSLWKTYSQKSDPKRRFTQVILLGIVYFAFCGSIIYIFGRPFVPYRGDISFWVDKIVLFVFSVLPLIMLIFWVVDATKLSVWLISRISEKKTAWPEGPTRCFGRALNIDPRYVNDCIDIRVIAEYSEVVGRLIYHPFLVFIVVLISRSRCFDNWDMPLGLVIVILLGMAYAVYCAVILRRSAEKARGMAVKQLWVQQVHAKGQGDEAKHISEQIGLMIESIRSLRQGAFLPFFQQPLVQALALFFGSSGSFLLLEYMSWMK
jgi:hypothetical protein